MGQAYEDTKPIPTSEVYKHPAVLDGSLELAVTGNDAYTDLYVFIYGWPVSCLLYTSPSPRD